MSNHATMNIKEIISSIKHIYDLPRVEQKDLFLLIMRYIKHNNSTFSIDEIFFPLIDLKIYFFLYMDDEEKSLYIPLLIQCINDNDDFNYQIIETLSIYYKFISKSLQEEIFSVFVEQSSKLLKNYRGITTVSIFIKNTHKVYSKTQRQKILLILNELNLACKIKESRDTYYYTLNNMDRHFQNTPNANILLIVPEFSTATSFVQPPLCMLQVASILKTKNIKFDILDNRVFSYSFEQLINFTNQYEFIVLTSSPLDQVQTYFLDHRHTIFCNLINTIKANNNSKTIIACGAHCTVRPDIIMNTTKADIILLGEYDIQLANLLSDLTKGIDVGQFPNIIENSPNGIKYHIRDYSIMHPDDWSRNRVDYSILQITDYYGYQYIGNTHLKKQNWAVIQSTRGCPYHCIFCYNFYTHRVRYKKIPIIIDEILQLVDNGTAEIFFLDQTFTINKEYARELCRQIINAGICIDWTCETRIDLVDEETLKLMRDAGCKGIWFGIESFDEEVLMKNKKGYQKTDYDYVVYLLNKYNIDYRAFIMLGMKGETKETLKKTVDEIVAHRIHISKTIVKCKERFGTELYDEIPMSERNKFQRFEHLGLRSGYISPNVNQQDINYAMKRLMQLNSE
jgi:radical SAM superfamily enzyme YgiQ (UPF0313 family)